MGFWNKKLKENYSRANHQFLYILIYERHSFWLFVHFFLSIFGYVFFHFFQNRRKNIKKKNLLTRILVGTSICLVLCNQFGVPVLGFSSFLLPFLWKPHMGEKETERERERKRKRVGKRRKKKCEIAFFMKKKN